MPETTGIVEALKSSLEKGQLEQSRSIIRGLPEVQDSEIVNLLIQALNYSTTQYEATHKLLKAGINPAPFLIALLDKSNNSNLKSLALLRLGREVNDPAAVPAIVTSLSSDPEEYVRRQAAFALGDFESEEALNALAVALKEDASWRVRERAARSLGLFKKIVTLTVLLEALEIEADSQVRSAIIGSLGKVGNQQIAPLLEHIVNNTQEGRGCRANAARALGQIHSEASIPLLRSVVANENEADGVREYAAQALAILKDKEALPLLIHFFKTTSSLAIQEDSLKSIIELGGEIVFELLMQIVLDRQQFTGNRLIAVDGLSDLEKHKEEIIAKLEELKKLEDLDDGSKDFDNLAVQVDRTIQLLRDGYSDI